MNSLLEQQLELLDFEVNQPSPSLLFTTQLYDSTSITFGARLILEEATRLSATAVYVRPTSVAQAPMPQVFIYDNTSNSLTESRLAEIHRQIWSSDIVSVYYVVDKTQLRIFDSRKPVQYKDNRIFVEPFETIELVAGAHEIYRKYSAKLFENGTFWEHPDHGNRFLYNNSSSQKLINELKKFRDRFVKQHQANSDLIHKIIVQSILIKYLEERRDEDGRSVFEDNFFAQFDDAADFCDAIRNGQFVNVLSVLSVHFNGKIFELSPVDSTAINKVSLTALADFLDAKLDNNQYSFWRLYAFNYVPVELISRIYEEFIPQRADAVYTPVHLAQFMVDECMPLEYPQEKFRIIDVSCGSGIFLVTAFKRMVQWWQKQRYEETGNLQRPSVKILQSILRSSIYGVDIEGDAVRLAVFSLSIALCDMLSPTEIWLTLKFDNLEEKNLRTDDFFHFLSLGQRKRFDLVIGNPPFKGSSDEVRRIFEQYNLQIEQSIPHEQIALLFLQQAMKLVNKSGLLCLVMPSGPLLYNKTLEYRKHFFSKYEIPQIADFSTLQGKGHLFEKEVATSVIFAKKQKPEPAHAILHITIKRTKAAREKRFFEIDHYDLNYVPLSIAISDSTVWKTNLFGGGQLYYLVDRLSKSRTLGSYLEQKKIDSKHRPDPDKWVYGEGYHIGSKKMYEAPHITGQPFVETDKFQEAGILEISIEREKHFYRPKQGADKLIFAPPHLLIKETPGDKKFVTAYLEEYLVFKHEIIGIHAPWQQKEELRRIERYLQENYLLLKALLLSFSSRAGISRSFSTVLKKDFMDLPFPEDISQLELTSNEEIIIQDILDYGLDELKRGEKALVNIKSVDERQLTAFGETFLANLNQIYQSNEKSFRLLEPIHGISYVCLPLFYGTPNDIPVISAQYRGKFDSLFENEYQSAIYKRIMFLYEHDIVYLIKPKTLRYWLKSIALRDVTQVMQDLIASGH